MNDTPLLVIIGRTASGKDVLARRLLMYGRTLVKTYTTRPMRPNEDESDYHFIDIQDIDNYTNRLLETEILGHHYFTTKEDLLSHDMLIIDAYGLSSLQKDPSFNRPYHVIYLDVDEALRRVRYMKRADASELDFRHRNQEEKHQFDMFERQTHPNVTVIQNEREFEEFIRKGVFND